jgi:hypothetical protein
MRTVFRPDVERLEVLTLLSNLAPHLMPRVPQTVTVASPLLVTLTTDQSTYTVGQPVHLTLTVTNRSQQTVTFIDGPAVDGFLVSQNGAIVWRSNAGLQPQFLRLVTLRPGQSYTLHATWDGHPNTSAGTELPGQSPTGLFNVTSQFHALGAVVPAATFTIQTV